MRAQPATHAARALSAGARNVLTPRCRTHLGLERLGEQAHDVLALDARGGEALGPVQERAAREAGLLHGEGEREAEVVGGVGRQLVGLEKVDDARRQKVEQLAMRAGIEGSGWG